jgi:hypothetical protein
MSPSARPFKIARLTGDASSAVLRPSALIILTEDKAAHGCGGALSNIGSGPGGGHRRRQRARDGKKMTASAAERHRLQLSRNHVAGCRPGGVWP